LISQSRGLGDVYKRQQMYNPMALVGAFFALIILLIGVLWILVPPPPKTIEMATGFPSGLYYQFGERLKVEVAKESVNLKIRSTGGTLDNLALLSDPKSGVDFAMVQGGVANLTQYPQLISIAGMFYEPIWVWYREGVFKGEGSQLRLLNQLKGKRVSIGNEGSGTLALTKDLLEASGITDQDISAQKLNPNDAIAKLKSGELDAAFVVAAAEAPILKKFFTIPGIRLMNFDQADAYTRNFSYLSKVTVPRGLLSIQLDQPHQDIQVMAATATLVARDNVSPALVSLLLGASYDILKSYSRLQKVGEFPSSTGLDFPLHSDAEIYLKDGPSFLHRHLPFWTAVWAGRFVKIVIPLLVILIPLFTYIPSAKHFLLRLKLARVYEELKWIEKNAHNPALKEKSFKDFEAIEKRVSNINVSMLSLIHI
jgi:TRAP transporter TAXI family solute receptor